VIFCGTRIALLICFIPLVGGVCPGTTPGASFVESQLFDDAYDAYLSYQPEKAVDGFTRFLKEFPDSSAKDAALFWLGKSLLQTDRREEAMRTFACLCEQFPESPFIGHLPKDAVPTGRVSDASWSWRPMPHTGDRQGQSRQDIPLTLGVAAERKDAYVARSPEAVPASHHAPEASEERREMGEETPRGGRSSPLAKENRGQTAYALQAGAFRTRDAALAFRDDLQKKVPAKKVTICRQGGFYKVRIMGFDSSEEIDSVLKTGVPGFAIKTSKGACGSDTKE